MRTGTNGRKAVLWSQTELDGLESAPLALLTVGSAWCWRGRSVNLSEAGVAGAAQTTGTETATLYMTDAASLVIGRTVSVEAEIKFSNGAQQFAAQLVRVEGEVTPVLIFENGCPARDQDFWISAFVSEANQINHLPNDDGTVVTFPVERASERFDRPVPQLAALAAE